MSLTSDFLKKQLADLEQQRISAANMVQQCTGAIYVIQKQIETLEKTPDVVKPEDC